MIMGPPGAEPVDIDHEGNHVRESTDWELDADVAECEHHAEACEICMGEIDR